jgi:hypothetical protein
MPKRLRQKGFLPADRLVFIRRKNFPHFPLTAPGRRHIFYSSRRDQHGAADSPWRVRPSRGSPRGTTPGVGTDLEGGVERAGAGNLAGAAAELTSDRLRRFFCLPPFDPRNSASNPSLKRFHGTRQGTPSERISCECSPINPASRNGKSRECFVRKTLVEGQARGNSRSSISLMNRSMDTG